MTALRIISVALACLTATTRLASASSLTPPILPLIVRNPYLSTWLSNARQEPWSDWPMFYTGEGIGLAIMAFEPQTSSVYPLLGRPHDSLGEKDKNYTLRFPSYLGAQFDASTTNLSYSIPHPSNHGSPLLLTVSFLSPITPTSTFRQAIPASYIHITVQATFELAVYVEVEGQWLSGSKDTKIKWQLEHHSHATPPQKSWVVARKTDHVFTELNDRAEWGTMWLTAADSVDHASGKSSVLRKAFARDGALMNVTDEHYRSIMDNEPGFAFATSFRPPQASAPKEAWNDSALFTIAHIQNPVVQYASGNGLTFMRPLWASYFDTAAELVTYHYGDFIHAEQLALNYSLQLQHDALPHGPEYADIVALSARQVMGATSFAGTPAQPLLFLKEISSNGNSQTVDVIFPSAPFFLYTNPRWLVYLLEPLLEHQLSGQYPNNYTMHDLGAHFPNLTGHTDGRDEYMPVEECGDMLIMALALANALQHEGADDSQFPSPVSASSSEATQQRHLFSLNQVIIAGRGVSGLDHHIGGLSGTDLAKQWVGRSLRLWHQWTGYLIKYSLEPQNQLCTDDFAGELALQTNLALKGIIGIRAMSELAKLVGQKDEYHYYRNISDAYIAKWQDLGISRDGRRAKLAYDWYGSWTTLYSLFADALLCFHTKQDDHSTSTSVEEHSQDPVAENLDSRADKTFIPQHIYEMQSEWYLTVMQKYGLPLDSRHLYAKSDWQFQAAAVASPQTRKEIFSRVALWLNETHTDRPFSDLYITEGDGGFPGPDFFARPVVGSHFAPMVLAGACGGHGGDAFE